MGQSSTFQIEYHCPDCGSITPIVPGITACLGCGKALLIIAAEKKQMSLSSWPSMTDRERDAELARAMGWTHVRDEYWVPPPMTTWEELETWRKRWPDAPLPYTTSLDAMRIVEDEIERRELQDNYIDALMQIVGCSAIGATTIDFWALLYASPSQRAEAAWKTLVKEVE